MKKLGMLTALALGITGMAFSQVDFRLFGEMSSAFEGNPVPENIAAGWGSGQNALSGMGWEVILGKTGFGSRAVVKFSQDPAKTWFLDFQSNFGLSHHLFGTGGLLDVFGEAGLGCAGGVDISHGTEKTDANLKGIALSLFPYLGFGGSVNLDNLLIGARVNYHSLNWAIPGAPIDTYPLSNLQFSVFLGFSTAKMEFRAPVTTRHDIRVRVESDDNNEDVSSRAPQKDLDESPFPEDEFDDWDDGWND